MHPDEDQSTPRKVDTLPSSDSSSTICLHGRSTIQAPSEHLSYNLEHLQHLWQTSPNTLKRCQLQLLLLFYNQRCLPDPTTTDLKNINNAIDISKFYLSMLDGSRLGLTEMEKTLIEFVRLSSARMFYARYQRDPDSGGGNIKDIDDAISILLQAASFEVIAALPSHQFQGQDHSPIWECKRLLASLYWKRGNVTQNRHDLDSAIVHIDQSIRARGPLGDPDLSCVKNMRLLFDTLFQRAHITGPELASETDRKSRVNRLISFYLKKYEDHIDFTYPISTLHALASDIAMVAGAYQERYYSTWDSRYLDEAIELWRFLKRKSSAVLIAAVPLEKRDAIKTKNTHSLSIHQLQMGLIERFRLSKSHDDFSEALMVLEELRDRPDRREYAVAQAWLGLLHLVRYEMDSTGAEDLEKSIMYLEDAYIYSRKGHGHSALDIYLQHVEFFSTMAFLTTALQRRYIALGNIDDLLRAKVIMDQVVMDSQINNSPPGGLPSTIPLFLEKKQTITFELLLRHDSSVTQGPRHSVVEDLSDQGVEELLELASNTEFYQSFYLENASLKLRENFYQTKNTQDLVAAVARCAEAAATVSPPFRNAEILCALSIMIGELYEAIGGDWLDWAISMGCDAVDTLPNVHCLRYSMNLHLGGLYNHVWSKHLKCSSSSAHGWMTCCKSHGYCLEGANALSQSKKEFLNAMAECDNVSPDDQIVIHVSCARWHREIARTACAEMIVEVLKDTAASLLEAAYLHYAKAVSLLAILSDRTVRLDDQLYKISGSNDHRHLASCAASMALETGRSAFQALHLLESGRGITIAKMIDYRSDISTLKRAYPDLATRFEYLRVKLDEYSVGTGSVIGSESIPGGPEQENYYNRLSNQRKVDVASLQETLAEIRQKPGFESFLLPPTESELRAAAKNGPIVVVTVSSIRGDAIIIQESGITSLLLEAANGDNVTKQLNKMKDAIADKSAFGNNEAMREVLRWLWEMIVKPVIVNLGFIKPRPLDTSEQPLPRVWWICAGLIANAPLHAAGFYPGSPRGREKAEYTSKYCISSYSPTLRALLYAQERDQGAAVGYQPSEHTSSAEDHFLVVTMPETPSHGSMAFKDLPGAHEESKIIMETLSGYTNVQYTHLDSPSSASVLVSLQTHNIVHFACHGFSDTRNPVNSSLLLCTDDGTLDELSIRTIVAMRPDSRSPELPPSLSLAYLSACSSASNNTRNFTEEGVHIGIAFQLAGFSHVIGTLWEADDVVCKEVAVDFYRILFERSSGQKGLRCAEALHMAVERVRSKYWRSPIMWAPFIHSGA